MQITESIHDSFRCSLVGSGKEKGVGGLSKSKRAAEDTFNLLAGIK
jgi:hypothetical protein